MQFKIGDVVTLKSGSPSMTVSNIEGNEAHVTWFVDGDVKYGAFPLALLRSVDEAPAAREPMWRR